ncbi:hypothetical protein A1O3_03890 [Capronia epimyces CBS 606.96]|uniref:Restriction of telomere capping protein 4 n=1 Tax=Capronia epimyces CBS 606.96 TaxID=1182542 RepID=W9YCH1_9EURO|nr:uncharacterized protein A1O3_03890 [Capronia epimyces CBS 606.96]EXJ86936.1 hypothetical protein A1O3_03890 [Capronia epimyces CBS 606.96]
MAPRRQAHDELAIYAQPLSSDDEEYNTSTKPPASPPKEPQGKITKSSRLSPKRPLTSATAATTRSKRRKIRDEPNSLDTLIARQDPAVPDTFSEWNSSGSQKRRLQRSYANRKFYQKPESLENEAGPSIAQDEFVSYEEVTKRRGGPKLELDFIPVATLPGKVMPRKPAPLETRLDIVDMPRKESPKERGFQLPDLPDFNSSATTASTTTGLEAPSIFGDRPPSDRLHDRRRSGSTSSLSSVDSMFILEHQGELLDQAGDLAAAEPSDLRCPVCQQKVSDSASLYVPAKLRTLPFKRQQDFCAQHQVVEAKEQWQDRGYPDINWKEFEEIRIPRKLPILQEIINRKTASFYLEQLDKKIKAARGNRKAVKLYLNQGIVDVAKQGYYGPKGARVMVGAITAELTRSLNMALRSDSALRAAGVGGYVSAVLVPELTSLLVMEDMGLQNSEEARRVLDKSSRIGALLNPDDDHIEREDDE